MVKSEDCKWKREKRVYYAQGFAIGCSVLTLIFGITCLIYTGRANVCNTNGPAGAARVGMYPAPMNFNSLAGQSAQPVNPIPECKAQCAAKWAQGAQLLVQCDKCLEKCTHRWGDNIDTCVEDPLCKFEHYKGVQNFCVGMAYCFSKCAGASIKQCAWDGKIAVAMGITGLTIGLLPMILVPMIAGFKHLNWILSLILAFLAFVAAIIISVDAFILNMNGQGWSWLYDAGLMKNITPNYVPGMIMCIVNAQIFFVLLAFWDPNEVWYRNQYNVRQEEYERKMAEEKRIADENARIEKERNERLKKESEEQAIREEEEEERQRLDKYYYGKKTHETTSAPASSSKPKQVVSETKQDSPAPAEDKPQVNVTVGLSFAYNDEQEVVVDAVAPNGPAAQTGLIVKGDVVCEVGDSPETPNGRPMKEVYKQEIQEWAHIVKNGAPGTKVRFILARHEEKKRFIADVVREPVP